MTALPMIEEILLRCPYCVYSVRVCVCMYSVRLCVCVQCWSVCVCMYSVGVCVEYASCGFTYCFTMLCYDAAVCQCTHVCIAFCKLCASVDSSDKM